MKGKVITPRFSRPLKEGDRIKCLNDKFHFSVHFNRPVKGLTYTVRKVIMDFGDTQEVLLKEVVNYTDPVLQREPEFNSSRFKKLT